MKRILLFVAVLLSAVSCFKNTGWSESYTLRVTFEFPDDVYQSYFTADSLFYDKEGSGFSWGRTALVFRHNVVDEAFTGGFMMSYQKGLPETGGEALDSTWRSNAAWGALGSRTYAVFYDNPAEGMMPDKDMVFAYSYYGTCSMSSCMVNNTALVAQKVRENFGLGDKLVLRATGYSGESKTGEAEFILAEFSSQKDSIVSEWTRFDLSRLGAVEYVTFDVISPDESVPGYFCIDEVIANIYLESR